VAVAATILLAAAVWNLAAAVIAATWPLLLIAAGIAAVVAVLIFAYQHWTGFRIVVDTVRDALGRFIAALGPAMSAIGGFVSGAIKWFGDLFNGLGTFIHTAIVVFQMGWALIQTIVQTAIAVLIGAFQNAYNHSYLFKAIVDIIMGAFTLARNFITSVWNGIVGFLSGAFNTIRSIATSAWNAFVSIILSAVGRASSAVHAVNNAITSTLGGIIGAVVAIGAQIVQGLIRGIQGMAGAVAGAVGRIAGMVKSGLQAALGIHSPSEVTMEMGAMLGQGLILGLYAQDVPGMVAKHLSAIGGAAVGGLNVGVSGSVSSASGGAISMSGSASNGGASGPQTVHIHNHLSIDGRELAGALGQPLVNEIRLRTGQHV
jgi:phage-related protein